MSTVWDETIFGDGEDKVALPRGGAGTRTLAGIRE